LLLEISKGNAAAKRHLRLELAAVQSPGAVAKEIRKRLTAIERSYSFVDWQKRQGFIEDLETQRRAIVDEVARADPEEGLELMWRFLSLANSTFERCDDHSGSLIDVFHEACAALGEIAESTHQDPKRLADQVFNALASNDYGQYDPLIECLAPALGQSGLNHLRSRLLKMLAPAGAATNFEEQEAVDGLPGGSIDSNWKKTRYWESRVRFALREIADALDDVDGYIAQYEEARTVPRVAAGIAQALDAIDEDRRGRIPYEWEQTRLDVLEALGRADEAQEFRWNCFRRSLATSHLRAFLKKLPDFEDIKAEEEALSLALDYPNVHQALAFLISWPAFEQAAELVRQRSIELDGDHYEILTPTAEALAEKHPLEATLLLRAMIDFSLKKGRSTRYRHAARHLAECASLAPEIDDFGVFEPHGSYAARLQKEHGRKSLFWSLAEQESIPR
jgi:hypothetical protein